MATWTALRDHMRRTYHLQDDATDLLSMVYAYEDGRHQKILVRRYRAFDREMVELKSAFARVGDASPEELLRRNAELPLATIALSGDVYLVVYNTPLEHLDLADFEVYLSRVADLADTLEAEFHRSDDF